MIRLIALIGLFLSSPLVIAEGNTGFSSGDIFTANRFQGRVWAYCPRSTRMHICRAGRLSPVPRDHFVFDGDIDADEVVLSNTNDLGETRTKKSAYSTRHNKSSKRFNLWINTLTQRALLYIGENEIRYSMKKDGDTIEEGEFTVHVEDGGMRYCRQGKVRFNNDRDCHNSFNICNRYWNRFDYFCR